MCSKDRIEWREDSIEQDYDKATNLNIKSDHREDIG